MECPKSWRWRRWMSSPTIPIWYERFTLCHGHLKLNSTERAALQQSKELVEKVKRLLEAAIANSTPVHLTPGASGADDEHFFLDFETAILGSSASDYAHFAAKMRDEYGFMADLDYMQLRLKVISSSNQFRSH